MKSFFSLAVALVTISGVFGQNNNLDETFVKESCKNQLKKYFKCDINILGKSYQDLNNNCDIFNSIECQEFFKNPYAVADMCEVQAKYFEPNPFFKNFEVWVDLRRAVCGKDNNGELCPIYEIYAKNIEDFNTRSKIISNNCKNSNCQKLYNAVLDHDIYFAKNFGKGDLNIIEKYYQINNQCEPLTSTTTTVDPISVVDPTSAVVPTTTVVPTSTIVPTSTVDSNSTVDSTSTVDPTSTVTSTTTIKSTTTIVSTTTIKSTTTVKSTTTNKPTETIVSTTTVAPATTTVAPTIKNTPKTKSRKCIVKKN